MLLHFSATNLSHVKRAFVNKIPSIDVADFVK